MTPEDRQRLDTLEKLVQELYRVENVEFIENIKRRGGTGMKSDTIAAATTITTAVRNAADNGSENVAKVPDGKLKVTLSDGSVKYIGLYNS